METQGKEPFACWAILELMGHRRLAGYVQEVEVAGQGLLRIDVPSEPPVTQFYSVASVYCITPTTEEVATSVAQRARPEPVHPWELPRLQEPESPWPDPSEPEDQPCEGCGSPSDGEDEDGRPLCTKCAAAAMDAE